MTHATGRAPQTLAAFLFVAANVFYLTSVIAARVGFGTRHVPPLRGSRGCVIFWWQAGEDAGAARHARIPSKEQMASSYLFGCDWRHTRYVQYMIVNECIVQTLHSSLHMYPISAIMIKSQRTSLMFRTPQILITIRYAPCRRQLIANPFSQLTTPELTLSQIHTIHDHSHRHQSVNFLSWKNTIRLIHRCQEMTRMTTHRTR